MKLLSSLILFWPSLFRVTQSYIHVKYNLPCARNSKPLLANKGPKSLNLLHPPQILVTVNCTPSCQQAGLKITLGLLPYKSWETIMQTITLGLLHGWPNFQPYRFLIGWGRKNCQVLFPLNPSCDAILKNEASITKEHSMHVIRKLSIRTCH